MPDEPLDPIEALKAVRTLARVTLEAEKPTPDLYARTLREIVNVCENALPSRRTRTKPKPPDA